MYIIFIIFLLSSQNVNNQNFGSDEGLHKIKQICRNAKINYKNTPKAQSLNDFLHKLSYDIKEEKNNTVYSTLYKLYTGDDLTLEKNPSEKYLFNIADKYIFNKGVLILCIFWICLIISFILGKWFFSEPNPRSNLFAKKYLNWAGVKLLSG